MARKGIPREQGISFCQAGELPILAKHRQPWLGGSWALAHKPWCLTEPTLRGLPRAPPTVISPPLSASATQNSGHHVDLGIMGLWSLLGSLGSVIKMCRKNHPPATAGPGSGPIIAAGRAPSRPLLLSAHPKVRLLFLFHILFACSLGSPSIKEWVGMREKLKCVITYSPSEPLASLRVICFLLYLVTRAHCAWLSLISIPHKPRCSGRLSKLKYQTFV